MNQVTEEQKSATTKILAIVGFIAAVVVIVWLVVQIVGVLPSAFSSLASIADTVYNYKEEPTLNVSTRNSVVNSNDSFTISWEKPRQDGTFTFQFYCEDGVAMNIRTAAGTTADLPCETIYDLGESTSVDVAIATERQRFTDITYQVTFVPAAESRTDTPETRTITIVNVSIPTNTSLAESTDTSEPILEPEVDATPIVNPSPETGAIPTAPAPTTPQPTYTQEVVYALPQSNPNGYTDLAVTYLGVGVLKNNVFVKSGTIDLDQQGAIRFMVKNIGTKTSEKWSFDAKLPSNISYRSDSQAPLKPNEQAIYTLGFEGIGRTGVETFSITLDVDEDTVETNNDFTWAITIVD